MPDANDQMIALQEDLKKRRLPAAVKRTIEAMLDKKAERISVLKLTGLCDISDYLIICTGQSTRQNQAIADEISSRLSKKMKTKPFNVEGNQSGEWILADYIDFVVHIFLPEIRDRYALEKMWMDAKRIDFFID